ncbi:MAG: hypothetical protein V1793_25165 [Pseudomonadota bacterium]
MTKNITELIQAGVDITETLTDEEKSLFGVCEQAIEADLKGFLAVGRALADIRDNRLYRETHKTFEKYCKDKWDLGRRYADQQIDGYEAVAFLGSKMRAIALKNETENKMPPIGIKNTPESSPDMNLGIDPINLDDFSDKYGVSYDERLAEAGRMCIPCDYCKGMAHKNKGVVIPGRHGKCTNPDGMCPDYKEAALKAAQGDMGDAESEQHEIILPINEAQARPLTKLKDPDDQVKAWGIVLEQLNQGKKLTASLVNKAVKEVRGEVVTKKRVAAKKELDSTQLVSKLFKNQYKIMMDILYEERNGGWVATSRNEAERWMKKLVEITQGQH